MIHDHLDRMDIHGKIREYVAETVQNRDDDVGTVSEEDLVRAIREKGIVDDVMRGLEFKGAKHKSEGRQDLATSPRKSAHPRGKFAEAGRINNAECTNKYNLFFHYPITSNGCMT